MSDTSSTLAPGVSAPLGSISQTDQSGLIAVLTALSLCFILAASSVHIYVRSTKGPWKIDDSLLAAGAMLACLQSALVFFEIHKGLGKVASLVDPGNQTVIKKLYYATNIFYIVVLCLSKTSVSFLYLHLMQIRTQFRIMYAVIGVSAFWCIVSILLICVECSWRDGCLDAFPRWLAIGVIDILTDAALAMMSIHMVKRLSTSLTRKLTVVCAFSTRLLVIPACAMRLYYLNPDTLSSNRTFALSLVVVCTQLQLGLSIMTASISSFKPLVAVYEVASVGSAPHHNGYVRYSTSRPIENPNHPNYSQRLDRLSVSTNRDTKPEKPVIAAEPASPAVSTSTASLLPNMYGRYSATVSVDGKSTHGSKRSARHRDVHDMIIERETCWSIHYDTENSKETELQETEKDLAI